MNWFWQTFLILLLSTCSFEVGRVFNKREFRHRRDNLLAFPLPPCYGDPEGIFIGERAWFTICPSGYVYEAGSFVGKDKLMRDRLFKILTKGKRVHHADDQE